MAFLIYRFRDAHYWRDCGYERLRNMYVWGVARRGKKCIAFKADDGREVQKKQGKLDMRQHRFERNLFEKITGGR